ncbi:MAG: alpha/beta hydrolase [Thermomicrobiales bacterium]
MTTQSTGFHRLVSRRAITRATIGITAGSIALASGTLATTAQEATPMPASTPQASPASSTPTVVLVHGAFADASGWAGVITFLKKAGIAVVAPPNPLRGIRSDAAYIASFANQLAGPVLMVGHSYGGAVITNAAPQVASAMGLVYVAAFIPDEGETLQALSAQASDSKLGPALRASNYPRPDGSTGQEFSIDPAAFHKVFCADLPEELATRMALSQRPAADIGFGEPSGPAGWKTLPSWAVIATADVTIGTLGLRAMAERAGATTVDVDSSHVAMISQPEAVANFIQKALASVA